MAPLRGSSLSCPSSADLKRRRATRIPKPGGILLAEEVWEREREDCQDYHHSVGHHFFRFGQAHAEEDQQKEQNPNMVAKREDVECEETENGAKCYGGNEGGLAACFDETYHTAGDHQDDVNPEHSLRVHRPRIVDAGARSKEKRKARVLTNAGV